MTVAIYDIGTGTILRWVTCPADMVDTQLSAGEEFYLNCPMDATHIVGGLPVSLEIKKDLVLSIRATRSNLLSACDWTQMPDVPLTTEQKQAWAAYRQALRDFPETCDPDNPVWPEPPR